MMMEQIASKLSSKDDWLAMPLRMVWTTGPPKNVAPTNSKTTARAAACLMVSALEPTEVA